MSRPSVKEKWRCPKCGRRLKMFVRTSEPPICRNTEQHSQTAVRMEADGTPDAEQ